VKAGSAAANGTIANAGSTTTATASSGPAVEKDVGVTVDPEADDEAIEGEDEVKEALSRPPPVNSDYLPLPWKGRIGYVRACHVTLILWCTLT
jgi:UV DNA damage endonuclease